MPCIETSLNHFEGIKIGRLGFKYAPHHENEEFVIFTNDIPYAKNYFKDIPIIQENELDTLYLMSQAKGCICVNSSFSWWGAYLNPNRPIFMPSKWFGNILMDKSGYYFKGVQIIEV